jgi:hypothetical protein
MKAVIIILCMKGFILLCLNAIVIPICLYIIKNTEYSSIYSDMKKFGYVSFESLLYSFLHKLFILIVIVGVEYRFMCDYSGSICMLLCRNKIISRKLIEREGSLIKKTSVEIDYDIARIAVGQDGRLLEHLSPELKNTYGVALTAVNQNGNALEFVSDELKHNQNFVIIALRQTRFALRYAPEVLKNDCLVIMHLFKIYYR